MTDIILHCTIWINLTNKFCLVSIDDALNPSDELGYFGVDSGLMWQTTPTSKRSNPSLHPVIVDVADQRASRVSLHAVKQTATLLLTLYRV